MLHEPTATPLIPITVLYFARLADIARKDEENLSIESGMSLPQLYEELAKQYQFPISKNRLGVAVNHAFCDWETPLQAGDIVAFIPPVAGG